jgi:hypothetical protein
LALAGAQFVAAPFRDALHRRRPGSCWIATPARKQN